MAFIASPTISLSQFVDSFPAPVYTRAMTPTRAATLRSRLQEPEILIVPGVYDAAGSKLVERAGFEAVYLTGAGLSMAQLGMPDIGLASVEEVLGRLAIIGDRTELPLIADWDTGYGGVLNVVRTV